MTKDLTTSAVARSNVLNNRYALSKLEEHLALGGLRIEGEVFFFKSHVAELLDMDERTIDRYLASHEAELKQNGYRVLKGKSLRGLKLAQVGDMHVADLIGPKVPTLGVFSFRAVLNVAMLMHELATNAIKHGSLSSPEGTVHVNSQIEDNDLVLRWVEEGGPPAVSPSHSGLGARLIGAGLLGTGGTVMNYRPEGFSAEFRANLRDMSEASKRQ